jgi:hypothetical protein
MLRSFLPIFAITLALTFGAVGCATQKPPGGNSLPTETIRTATMNITPGIEVLARVALPDGFVPVPDYPPMWLQAGKEVAVAGTRAGHTMVMGYGGTGYRTARVIAEDGGVGAPDGSIVDLAVSPDGMVLALAVNKAQNKRLDVVTRDVISEGAANPISSFDGEFESVSIGWLGQFVIPLALRAPAESEAAQAPATAPPDSTSAPIAAGASSGLYTVNMSGVVTTGYLKLNCKMSLLSWSPQGLVAVGAGDANTQAIILDREKETCERLNAQAPIRVLDWAHDSKSFLYAETNPAVGTGVYRKDLANNTLRLVAISSGAAAFVGNDQVLALGSGALTFRSAKAAPDGPVRAEVALSNPKGSETEVSILGFNSTPAMLAASTMTYTRETDSAAIATFGPSTEGPMRKIVIYSVAPKRAFLIAFGPPRGAVAMSWSPRGRYLAIADGDATAAALTIISPPR